MATAEKTRIDPTPLYAFVGATDLAIEQLRAVVTRSAEAQAQLEARIAKLQADLEKAVGRGQKAVTDFDPKKAGEQIQTLPTDLAAKVLEAASKASSTAEETYGAFAARGKGLVDRIQGQKSTQDLIAQGKSTIARGKGAVTSARKAADATVNGALGTVGVGRKEAEVAVTKTENAAKTSARTATKKTTSTAKKAASTSRAKTSTATAQAKGARTSAKKTTATAKKAASDTAKKVGD